MIKEALQYIVNLATPNVKEYGGEIYSDKPLHRIKHNPKAKAIEMSTLSSLVEYIRSNADKFHGNTIIHVQSPTRVQMYSSLDEDRIRETLVEVTAQVPSFDFNRFMDHENFCIGMQSKCENDETTDRALLLKFAGTVEAGSVAEYGDDGISQKATVKTGIASKGEALVPSPVRLRPYRTFIEVEQPVSDFVFRMNQDRSGGIQCALYEADGGAWKIKAMTAICEYLKAALSDCPEFVVIS